MISRTIIINCCRKYNAVYRGGQLIAAKNIRYGDPIFLKDNPRVKLPRDVAVEMNRLAQVSLEHAKRN